MWLHDNRQLMCPRATADWLAVLTGISTAAGRHTCAGTPRGRCTIAVPSWTRDIQPSSRMQCASSSDASIQPERTPEITPEVPSTGQRKCVLPGMYHAEPTTECPVSADVSYCKHHHRLVGADMAHWTWMHISDSITPVSNCITPAAYQ